MRVRTIRTHLYNGCTKDGSAGAVEEVPDAEAANLIAMGYVEDASVVAEEPEAAAPSRKGKRG